MKIFNWTIIFLLLFPEKLFSQDNSQFYYTVDSLPVQGVLLDKGWKFHPGDDPGWVSPEFDDSKWVDINPTLEIYYLPQIRKEAVGWFRIHLRVDSSLINIPLAFHVFQTIASEIYIDGNLIRKYGNVSQSKADINAFNPNDALVGLLFRKKEIVIAVRFSTQNGLPYFRHVNSPNVFQFQINEIDNAAKAKDSNAITRFLEIFESGLFLIISLIHLGLFISFRKQKANLYFSISAFSYSMVTVLGTIISNSHSVSFRTFALVVHFSLLFSIYGVFLFMAIWQLFVGKRNIWFWLITLYSGIGIIIALVYFEWGWFWGFIVPLIICMLVSAGITFRAWQRAYRGVEILLVGMLLYIVTLSFFILMYTGFMPFPVLFSDFTLIGLCWHLSAVSIPVSLSIYLAREFAFTSKELEKKLAEVQDLSEKAITQELEKQKILASQNETLEIQVAERTSELNHSLQNLKATQAQLIQSEKMASLGELTAGIAHEIQNPLNFVNNFSEVNRELIVEMQQEMKAGNLSEANTIAFDIKDNEEKINHHGKRADAIVKNMLQHSRAGAGDKELTDVNSLADEYLKLAYHGFKAKDKNFNTTLQVDFDQAVGKINIIPPDIGRVLLNMYNNAFYAVSEKKKKDPAHNPEVEVKTARKGNQVEITVRDNGSGIPENIMDKIFQPFFTTKPTGQGTGLGLSLSYDIIKAHGGEIKVKSIEGSGSEFVIILTGNV